MIGCDPETRTMPSVEWLEFTAWFDAEPWIRFLNNLNEKEAQIGLSPTEWQAIGAFPSISDWVDAGYESNPSMHPMNHMKTWLQQARTSLSRHVGAHLDAACRRWKWRDRGSISAAIAAIPNATDDISGWLATINGYEELVDSLLNVQEHTFSVLRVDFVIFERDNRITDTDARYGVLPDGYHQDAVALYSRPYSGCGGPYYDRPGYRYVVSCVDTYGKNAMPEIDPDLGHEGVFLGDIDADGVLVLWARFFWEFPDETGSSVSFYESDDGEHGGMVSMLIDESEATPFDDALVIGEEENVCGYELQVWEQPPMTGPTEMKWLGWSYAVSAVVTATLKIVFEGSSRPVSGHVTGFAPGVSIEIPIEFYAYAEDVACSIDRSSVIVDSSLSGASMDFDVTFTADRVQPFTGQYAFEETTPYTSYSSPGTAAAVFEMKETRGGIRVAGERITADLCIDACGKVVAIEVIS